jgi:RTX calcium-binding nonapeptide repeat (4 copies)
MATTQDYALLSLYVYNVALVDEPNNKSNRPLLPSGWELAEPLHKDDFLGFSYGVFRRIGTTEIVVAYTGTNEGRDWWSNGLAGTGLLPSPQIAAAAKAYLNAKAAYGPNITLSGHSLGGGLASVMAVWFDRPAVVFDEGPFEATALNPLVMAAVAASLVVTGNAVPSEFLSYIAGYLVMYGPREAQVANNYLQGEVLASLRAAWPTVLGNDYRIDINGVDASSTQLHSISLLVAAKMSESFRLATYASNSVIPLVLSEHLYGFNTATSADRNFLIDLIRSEQTNSGNGKLTHFAADLQKLGTTVAGLSVAAQNAIIAQGIEWYYWQSNNYGGQEFFTQTGNLLQYTTAQGAGLDGALNKASLYTGAWLATLNSAYGLAYMPIIKTDYQQWNINGGVNAVTATAKNIDKTQIFIGQAGSDTFTGGNRDDVFFAGGGADTLDGGLGVFNCKNNRKHYKKHSTLGIKYAGYRQKWHSKSLTTGQIASSMKEVHI